MVDKSISATARVVLSMEVSISGANYGSTWTVEQIHKDARSGAMSVVQQIREKFPRVIQNCIVESMSIKIITFESKD